MEKKKDTLIYRFFGLLLYFFLKLLIMTFKCKVITSPILKINQEAYIGCFWHTKLLAASVTMDFFKKKAVLISPSKDGELISVPLEKLGFTVVRGSSGQRAASGLRSLLKLVQKGYSIGTPVDGPKGPVHKVKAGLLRLAQDTGTAIMPLGSAFQSKWTFAKTWDKMQLPKPFSKIICILGDPIYIPKEASIKEYQDMIADKINELDEKAENLVKEKMNK